MAIRKDNKIRKVPSPQMKVRAIFDIKRFADMISFHGGMANFGKVHRDGLDWVESHRGQHSIRELILMPRGHLKTTIFTVLDILHQIYINPNIRIYVGSANQSLSKAILREVVANLTDPWLQEFVWDVRPHFSGRLVPLMDKGARQRRMERLEDDGQFSEIDSDMTDDKKKIWRQDAIQVIRPYKLKEPTVVIGSTESPATGFHYDRLYFDDIINFENYDKPEKIDRLDVWRNDMFSVLDDSYVDTDLYEAIKEAKIGHKYITDSMIAPLCIVGGFCRAVGTRYFKHDWYKQIVDNNKTAEHEDEKWHTWVRNIYADGGTRIGDNGYLWAEKWNETIERKRRKEVTKKHFYAQYLNEVIVEEDQLLTMSEIKAFNSFQVSFAHVGSNRILIKHSDKDEPIEVQLRMCIDPAATCNPDSDFTAIAVGGKDCEGNLYVADLRVVKYTSDKWIKLMYEMASKWNIKAIHLETVAFAVELKNTIRMRFSQDGCFPLAIREYKPGNRASKKERIEAGLEPLIQNGMLYFDTHLFNHGEICDQFNYFPSETVKDDAPDVVQMLNEVCLKTTKSSNKVVDMDSFVNSRWGGYY